MGGRNPVAVEHAEDVLDGVLEGVARSSGGIFRRKTGVALVIADDEATMLGQAQTEALTPPQHRRHPAHNQNDGRARRVAERFRGDF